MEAQVEQEVVINPDEFASVIEALEEGIAQLLMAAAYAQSVGDSTQSIEMAESASKAEKVKDRLANTSPNMYFI